MGKYQMGKGFALVVIGLMTILLLPSGVPTEAGGGGILVNGTEICLNGVRFEATLVDVIAQNHPMETAVYTLNPYLEIAFGADYEFTHIGETQTFTITYPSSTLEAGDSISIAVQTLDGALAGGGGIYTVNDCIIAELDARLNHDLAAPVVMYQHETIDVYTVVPETSKGILLMRFSLEAVDGRTPNELTILGSTVNSATNLPVIVYRLRTGEIQVSTYYANGKPYVFRWHPSQPYEGVHVEW